MYNESLNASLVPFLRKEAAEKEDDDDEKTSRPCHWEAATTTARQPHQISQSHVLVEVPHLPRLFV
jgi:hypothetical protein